MATDMNETFMVRTTTPEIFTDDSESSIDQLQTTLTQVQLKATLNHDEQQSHVQTHRSPLTSIELVVLPKTQADIIVSSRPYVDELLSCLRMFIRLVSQCYRSQCWRMSFHDKFINIEKIRRFHVSCHVQWTLRCGQRSRWPYIHRS
jgi:hypothetical protein